MFKGRKIRKQSKNDNLEIKNMKSKEQKNEIKQSISVDVTSIRKHVPGTRRR
jgi:hypothetical protein